MEPCHDNHTENFTAKLNHKHWRPERAAHQHGDPEYCSPAAQINVHIQQWELSKQPAKILSQ